MIYNGNIVLSITLYGNIGIGGVLALHNDMFV